MFEKEAEDSFKCKKVLYKWETDKHSYIDGFKDGAQFVYNKCNIELEKENAELKSKNCWKTCEYAEPKSQWISQHIQDVAQLSKAKELIQDLIDSLEVIDGEQIRELKVVKEAEQFISV